MLFDELKSSAVISECGHYRYRLDREVAESGIVFGYFGINPSTADALRDDQTVSRVQPLVSMTARLITLERLSCG